MTTVFHAWTYGRFIEIQRNLDERNFIEQIKAPIFLEAEMDVMKFRNNSMVCGLPQK